MVSLLVILNKLALTNILEMEGCLCLFVLHVFFNSFVRVLHVLISWVFSVYWYKDSGPAVVGGFRKVR